jgi:GH18 family chitinase
MGACNTNDGTVCPGWGHPTQSEIDAFLAARHTGKKALISIGDRSIGDGVTGGQLTWDIDTGPGGIDTFVQNIANVVNQTGRGYGGFDGVDIDWESPDAIGQAQFPTLLAKLRAALPGKIITLDAGDWNNLPNIAAAAQVSLDQVNVMCFDMDGSSQSWYNDALYSGSSGRESCSLRIGRIITAGVAPAKVSVGIPFYTRKWTGCTQTLFTPCTQVKAENYRDLVTDPARWQPQYRKYDNTYKSNYLSIPSNSNGQPEFDSFDGPQSIQDIVAWGKSQGFGGFFNYSFDSEYISSRSGDARYPLSTALAQAVGR